MRNERLHVTQHTSNYAIALWTAVIWRILLHLAKKKSCKTSFRSDRLMDGCKNGWADRWIQISGLL